MSDVALILMFAAWFVTGFGWGRMSCDELPFGGHW